MKSLDTAKATATGVDAAACVGTDVSATVGKSADAARVRYLTLAQARQLVNASDSEFRPPRASGTADRGRYSELARQDVADFNRDSGTLADPGITIGKAPQQELPGRGSQGQPGAWRGG